MMKHKFSLNPRQITLLDELMDADRKDNGICYQDEKGNYQDEIKKDIDFLKSLGFITEYTSETHITQEKAVYKKGWTITYHGIAFLFAYHTLKVEANG
jgi:hypothetical protein